MSRCNIKSWKSYFDANERNNQMRFPCREGTERTTLVVLVIVSSFSFIQPQPWIECIHKFRDIYRLAINYKRLCIRKWSRVEEKTPCRTYEIEDETFKMIGILFGSDNTHERNRRKKMNQWTFISKLFWCKNILNWDFHVADCSALVAFLPGEERKQLYR